MVVYFKLNPVDGFNKPVEEEKREDISITFDGRTYTLTDNYGKVVREIAAHRIYRNDHSFGHGELLDETLSIIRVRAYATALRTAGHTYDYYSPVRSSFPTPICKSSSFIASWQSAPS